MNRLAVAGLMLLSSAAHAQTRSALPAQLAAPTRDTLQRLIDSARAVGLPGEPLMAKAAEGALKGADDTRIVRAPFALWCASWERPGRASPAMPAYRR